MKKIIHMGTAFTLALVLSNCTNKTDSASLAVEPSVSDGTPVPTGGEPATPEDGQVPAGGESSMKVAPEAVTNLKSTSQTNNSLTFSFTLPKNTDQPNVFYSYRVRYSTQPITAANFANATLFASVTNASAFEQTFTIPNLTAGTAYYISLKVYSDVSNFSAISNVVMKNTVALAALPALPAWTKPSKVFCDSTSALDKPIFYAGQMAFDLLGRAPTLTELKTQAPLAVAAVSACTTLNCKWKALAALTMKTLNSPEGMSVNGATTSDNTKFINLIYSKYLHQTAPAADVTTINTWLTKKAMTQDDLMTYALMSTQYRQDFFWEGKCGMPIIGTNGHPMNSEVYLAKGILPEEQFKLMNSLGLREYRVNIQGTTDPVAQIPRIQGLLDLSIKYKVELLPAIFSYPSSSGTASSNYQKAFDYAKAVVTPFKGKFVQWELQNELDNTLLITGKTGYSDSDYDQAGMAMYAASYNGLVDGLHAADPNAKTIVNFAGYTHTGFIAGMVTRGVKFDIIGLHWYSNMGDMTCPTQQFPCPAVPKNQNTFALLKTAAPGKPIRLTEGDYAPSTALSSAENEIRQQDKLYTMLMTWLHMPRAYPIERFDIYELLSEVQKEKTSFIEANFGLFAMKDNGNGTYSMDHTKPAGLMLPLLMGDSVK